MRDGVKAVGKLCLCSALLISCRTVNTTSSSKALDTENYRMDMPTPPPPILCPPGSEAMPLTIVPPQNSAKATDFGFPEKQFISAVERTGFVYRLDTCASADNTLSLVRLSTMLPPIPQGPHRVHPASYSVVNLAPDAKVKGLDEAMLNSDGSKIAILLPTSRGEAYHLSGTTVNGEALISVFEGAIDSPKKSVTDVNFGALEVADPFPPLEVGQCNSTETRSIVKFNFFGNIELAFKGCFTPERGIGPGEVLRIEEVSVRDDGIEGAEKGKLIVMKPGDKDFSAGQSSMHHNVCIYYSVKFPHATYGITQHLKPGNTGAQTSACGASGDAPALTESFGLNNAAVFISRGSGKPFVSKGSTPITKTVTPID